MNLFKQVKKCIQINSIAEKTQTVLDTVADWQRGHFSIEEDFPEDLLQPGKAKSITYVNPQKVARRSVFTPEGKAAMMHAIAHIEYSAIDLALDAVFRFQHCPRSYYQDWMQIAKEETHHFIMINQYLAAMDYTYGDFPVHGRLWEVAMETRHDVLYRMALVPRVFEARGLDATPAIIKKFTKIEDQAAIDILEFIEKEEVGHVKVGTYWFNFFCQQRGLDPEMTFKKILTESNDIYIKRPLAYESRKQAGFTDAEINFLDGIAQ